MKFTIPNQLTLFRILLTPVFVYLFIQPESATRVGATAVFIIASFTDWYDGYIARRLNLVSRWGQFMDPLADKILVSSALLAFAYMDYVYWWMVFIIIGRDALITILRSFAVYIGKPIITSTFAKWKTFLQMAFTFALLVYINIPGLPDIILSNNPQPWLLWTNILLGLVVTFTIFSALHYLFMNRSHVVELFRRTGSTILRLAHIKK